MFEVKDVKYFDVHDLQRYVKETYGKDLDLIRRHAEFSGNDTIVKIDVDKEMPDEGWCPENIMLYSRPEEALEKWLAGDDSINANECLILWDMCRKGVIPEGKYIMDTWW